MIIEIKNCGECPALHPTDKSISEWHNDNLWSRYEASQICRLFPYNNEDLDDDDSHVDTATIPSWCPLLKKEVT